MGRSRDIGAVDILNNASVTKSYDGIYTKNMEATKNKDTAYDYVDTKKNTYMATTLDTETTISGQKNVDQVSKNKLNASGAESYKGQNIDGFVTDEALPYMYKESSGKATNINSTSQYEATFREVIIGN